MNIGTRFVATKEAPVHENVKKALVAASELDTRLVMRAIRNTERVLKNGGVDRLIEIEREKGVRLKIEDIHDEVGGRLSKVMIDGDMDAGAPGVARWSATRPHRHQRRPDRDFRDPAACAGGCGFDARARQRLFRHGDSSGCQLRYRAAAQGIATHRAGRGGAQEADVAVNPNN
jgi:hypothetical protein